MLLQHGWEINDRWRPYMLPSICTAIKNNDQELVEWFIAHGATSHLGHNAYTSFTPLTYATIYASSAIMKLLVEHGGRLEYGNLLSALSQSTLPERLHIFDFLVEEGAPLDRLDNSHLHRRLDFAERLEVGTPLHAAVRNNRTALAGALIGKGARRDVKDAKGRTAVELARELGLPSMVELLAD